MPPLRLDLAGLREEYVIGQEEPAWTPRQARAYLAGASGILVLVYVTLAVVVGPADVPWGPLVAMPVGMVLANRWQMRPRRRPRTRLTPTELHLRERPSVEDVLPWGDVLVVTARRAQKRAPGEVHLRDGRRLRLVGMPADDVVRLAEALDRARAAAADGR